MKKGHLSEYFLSIAHKKLSAVEVDSERSNQYEFNGDRSLVKIFGKAEDRRVNISAHLIYLSRDDFVDKEDIDLTWHDARAKHETRSEHRLYFKGSETMDKVAEGDLMIIGKKRDGSFLIVVGQSETTAKKQLKWLFGLNGEIEEGFIIAEESSLDEIKTGMVLNQLLEELDINIEPESDDCLDKIIATFGDAFPTTYKFSEFAREMTKEVSSMEDPDGALMTWMEQEERLFRVFERYLLSDKIKSGFKDVDEFIAVSLSIQNKRKSRAGYALQNQLCQVFEDCGVGFSRDKVTENRKTPDFMFPTITDYHDMSFPVNRLTMLGAKTSCKDRWRQVLSEADRITNKHLITLEPAISKNQTDEMTASELQLVVPKIIYASYSDEQQAWLMNLEEFIKLVKERQKKY